MIITLDLVKQLNDLKVEHRNWQEALALVFALLTTVSPGEVICITGPSRAGKTRLIRELSKLLIGDGSHIGKGEIPIVTVEAVNCSSNGSFSTKSFTKRLLRAVQHPIYASEEPDQLTKRDQISEDTYRQALELAFVARKVRYLFIDEAQHAKYVSRNAQGAYALLDSWKCLAQVTGVILIIVGAYPILDIIRNTPHMIGRKHQINLDRYQPTPNDLEEFKGILEQYGSIIGATKVLLKDIEYIYKKSLGCIGLIQNWLVTASSLAAVRGTELTFDILAEVSPSLEDIKSVRAEISHGETVLGINETPPTPKESKPKRTSKPFQRKAKRISPNDRNGVGND